MKKKTEFNIGSKYILIILTVVCIGLIGFSSTDASNMAPLRFVAGYVLVPIQKGINQAGTFLYDKIASIKEMQSALNENQKLKLKVSELMEETNRLQQERYELTRLRELYELDQEYMDYPKVGAKVIAKDSGNWFHIFRIDKGSNDGMAVDMNVIAGGGLVGIITDVGPNYSTVRSIIDDSSKVSGMAMESSADCIISGDLLLYEKKRLRLSHVNKGDSIENDNKIVTSNISDKFLPGILIGYAKDITVDANNLTKSGYLLPVADFDNLQEVLVITKLKETGTSESE